MLRSDWLSYYWAIVAKSAGFLVVSLAAIFWMSRNAPPFGGALRDIQKTAARETSFLAAKKD